MGFDLLGTKENFCVGWVGWRTVYNLAIENGWKPTGTKPPNKETMAQLHGGPPSHPLSDDWDGSYFSSDFQIVTEEDATNMADALDRSLELQTSDDDEWLRSFSRFARSGEFVIA